MTKKTDMLSVRKAYEAPSVELVLLQAENSLCAGSQEGFGGDESVYPFSLPGLEMPGGSDLGLGMGPGSLTL